QAVAYRYDVPGRTRTLYYPGGRVTTNISDVRDRLARIDDATSSAPIVRYTYDSGDRVLTRTNRGGVVSSYGYNANDWVTNLTHQFAGTNIAGFGYTYDKEGNKRTEQNLVFSSLSETYAYDTIYRLTN